MWIAFILFAVIWFFTMKQLYTYRHFTGASKILPAVYMLYGYVSLSFECFVLYRLFRRYGFLKTVLCLLIAIVLWQLINRLISRAILYRFREWINTEGNFGLAYYNRKCDVACSIVSAVGLPVIPIAAVCLITFKLI